jgi:hypothetical protein
MTSTTNVHAPDVTPSPGLPPRDAQAVNANDVRRFVYTWFTLFEHRAPAARLAAHLATSRPVSLTFPGAEPLREIQQFIDWYEQLLANTRWNFHELSRLTVELAGDGAYDVAFDIDWQGGVTEDSAWPTNLPERRFRFAVHQRWRVAVDSGSALDNPFFIVSLVAELR